MERLPGDGWREALDLFNAQKEDLYAGRIPRTRHKQELLQLRDLCNEFRTAKLRRFRAGRIARQTYENYVKTCDLLVAEFGGDRVVGSLEPADFAALLETMGKRWGLVRLGNEVTRVKSVFRYGTENIKTMPRVIFGSDFKMPSASEMRRHKAEAGPKMLEAPQLRFLLNAADTRMRAMLLLGLNCGFNNKDCADLPLEAVDLDGGWVDFPRQKTGIERRCPLWPETVEALRAAIATRPTPTTPEGGPARS